MSVFQTRASRGYRDPVMLATIEHNRYRAAT